MSDLKTGWYWVKYHNENTWEVAMCEVTSGGKEFFRPFNCYDGMERKNFIQHYEIGPRILTPDEKGEG